jgi:hypothetical protein
MVLNQKKIGIKKIENSKYFLKNSRTFKKFLEIS